MHCDNFELYQSTPIDIRVQHRALPVTRSFALQLLSIVLSVTAPEGVRI